MIDCGADWLHRVRRIQPEAIVITHAHPDHVWGLKGGAPCRVYATDETWQCIKRFPLPDRISIAPRTPFPIHEMLFEAFPVEHSVRAPAVGYRITAGRTAIFYVPDLLYIHDGQDALQGIGVYIGDGASLWRPLVRRKGESLIGHAAIRTQLDWCRQARVPKAFITHCGSQIVRSDARCMNRLIHDLGIERGVAARIASDGLEVRLA
jgi:phosphoribosyl 1,2-cyclic phosphodiesterase